MRKAVISLDGNDGSSEIRRGAGPQARPSLTDRECFGSYQEPPLVAEQPPLSAVPVEHERFEAPVIEDKELDAA